MSKARYIEFNPVAMNINNRIAPGCRFAGPIELTSGLCLDGIVEGDLIVRGGVLWVSKEANLRGGAIRVEGDMYVFGQVGAEDAGSTSVVCTGKLVMAESSICYAKVQCAQLDIMIGARMLGPLQTYFD